MQIPNFKTLLFQQTYFIPAFHILLSTRFLLNLLIRLIMLSRHNFFPLQFLLFSLSILFKTATLPSTPLTFNCNRQFFKIPLRPSSLNLNSRFLLQLKLRRSVSLLTLYPHIIHRRMHLPCRVMPSSLFLPQSPTLWNPLNNGC